MTNQANQDKRAEFLARIAALKAKSPIQIVPGAEPQSPIAPTLPTVPAAPMPGQQSDALAPAVPILPAIVWNTEQTQAIELGANLRPFVLIGAAGTGKTTTIKEVIRRIIANMPHKIKKRTKYLNVDTPAVALVSFTNRAVRNIKRAVRDIPEIEHNVLTIHKLLQFRPEQVSVIGDDGEAITSRRFVPTFDSFNPIEDLRLVIIDEASMVDTRLFKQLYDACPNAQFVFIGDLNQLPPVFGDAILGFKLAELPVVELTRVYRQALESPIISFQHSFTLQGRTFGDSVMQKFNDGEFGKGLTFKPFKLKLEAENMCAAFADFIRREHLAGNWDWREDAILIPYNKAFGTIGINREIAQWMGDARDADVHEILAGRNTKYLARGDFVIHQKTEYIVWDITPNSAYIGRPPKMHSPHLKRDGTYKLGKKPKDLFDAAFAATSDEQFDKLLNQTEAEINSAFGDGDDDEEGKKVQASHHVKLIPLDAWELLDKSEQELQLDNIGLITVKTMGDVGSLDFGYAITVHKSQGSEWRKVYFVISNHHSPMLSRELLYTGMTRAREELMVIYSPESKPSAKDSSVAKAIKAQKVYGRTWQDKVEVFKGKQDSYRAIMSGQET